MTREEAIEWLKAISTREFGWDEYAMQESQKEIRERCEECVRESLRMAIEALQREEAEEKGWCHRIRPKNVEVVVRCKDCRHRDLFSCP